MVFELSIPEEKEDRVSDHNVRGRSLKTIASSHFGPFDQDQAQEQRLAQQYRNPENLEQAGQGSREAHIQAI